MDTVIICLLSSQALGFVLTGHGLSRFDLALNGWKETGRTPTRVTHDPRLHLANDMFPGEKAKPVWARREGAPAFCARQRRRWAGSMTQHDFHTEATMTTIGIGAAIVGVIAFLLQGLRVLAYARSPQRVTDERLRDLRR